jgi:hypothetical protein
VLEILQFDQTMITLILVNIFHDSTDQIENPHMFINIFEAMNEGTKSL